MVWMKTVHNDKGSETNTNDMLCRLNENLSVKEFRNIFKGGGMLWQFILRKHIIIEHEIQFVEWAKWFEDVDFLLQYQCFIQNVFIYKRKWTYRYYINSDGAMRNSNYSDRLLCSIKLSVNALKRIYPDKKSQRFVENLNAVSMAWCLREAKGDEAIKLYNFIRPHIPLRLYGTWRQRFQIFLLNLNFNLFKILF